MSARRAGSSPLRAIAWYGEDGDPSAFVGSLSARFATRYSASGRLRWTTTDPPAVEIVSLVVTDREGGGEVRMRGERVTLTAGGQATPEYVKGLWTDARAILGLARRQLGRRRGTTVTDEALRRVIAEMNRAGRIVTLKTIASSSATFTYDELRYFLRVNGRHLSDYL